MGEFDIKALSDYPSSEGLRKISVGTCGLVCSSQIDIAVDGDVIRKVQFTGGCNGNTQGVAALAAGMKVKDAIARLEGIDCGGRGTSCPDQLARANFHHWKIMSIFAYMTETDIKSTLGREDVIDLIGKQWMLVTAGTKDIYNTMTASWGGIGFLWNRPVAFVFIRPERYTHEFIEKNERLTLSFYPEEWRKALQICGTKSGRDIDKAKETGLAPVELEEGVMTFEQARLTIVGRKLFKASMQEVDFIDKSVLEQWYGGSHGGLHDVYVVEIEKVYE